MNRNFDIVIVGAGVTGLTIAALLTQGQNKDNLRITVVDAANRPAYDPEQDVALRVSAIAAGSAQLLDTVGAWESIAASRIGVYDRMRVWDEAGSPDSTTTLRFDAADFALPQLGFIVENVLLRHALLEQLDSENVELRFAAPLQAVSMRGRRVRLELEHGQMLDADLVIAADGAQSYVRQSLGIETREWPYEQTAVVTHLRPQKSHRNTAWQRFLRDGPLGMLPLADGRISIVWTTTDAKAERAMSVGDAELGHLTSEASGHVLGGLTVEGERAAFPLCARHATNYVVPHVALIGDAAHAVHPLAGQGANLGLQDAATLAAVINEAVSKGEHPGDRPVLRRYERARKGANATMLHFMTGLNGLFATDSEVVRELRAIGMQLFNQSGPIRDRAVRVALGVGRGHGATL